MHFSQYINTTSTAKLVRKPYSATVLALCGILLIGIGLYFILIRPPFLPEDARNVGASISSIQTVAPGMAEWLGRVLTVLGGYIIATGMLTVYIASTSFRRRSKGAIISIVLAGITSIGLMATINILIKSDFKWPLVSLAALWALAVVLNLKGK